MEIVLVHVYVYMFVAANYLYLLWLDKNAGPRFKRIWAMLLPDFNPQDTELSSLVVKQAL